MELTDGEQIRLPSEQTDIGDAEAARLCKRIEEARAAHRSGGAPGATDILARGGREVHAWVTFLRGIGAGAAGPRTPALPKDVLLRVVEDSKASPIERASAAVAAVEGGGEDARQRVRIAAEASASPKLRIALERIVEAPDEQEIEEALETLELELTP